MLMNYGATTPQIFYLGHSGWVVDTGTKYLIFDAQDENIKNNGKLAEGYIDLSLPYSKPIYNFSSHSHHDHYSRLLHKTCISQPGALTILGDFNSLSQANTISLKSRDKYETGDIIIHTAPSTDAGVCFLAECDGFVFFHAGDNADWGDGDQNKEYYPAIDYIAEIAPKIDFAFIPVCTFSGTRPKDMTKGAIYAVKTLKPKITFPMHANGREHLYKEFERDLRQAGVSGELVCA